MKGQANKKAQPKELVALIKELRGGIKLEKSLAKLTELQKDAMEKRLQEGLPKPKNKIRLAKK